MLTKKQKYNGSMCHNIRVRSRSHLYDCFIAVKQNSTISFFIILNNVYICMLLKFISVPKVQIIIGKRQILFNYKMIGCAKRASSYHDLYQQVRCTMSLKSIGPNVLLSFSTWCSMINQLQCTHYRDPVRSTACSYYHRFQ